MNDNPTAYPLAWPAGKPRTPSHKQERGRFGKSRNVSSGDFSYSRRGELTLAESVSRVMAEMGRLGAQRPIISTNVAVRLDGLPRSGQRKPDDPGVAVYFQLKKKPIVLACDHYDTIEANLAAVAAHVEAMRAMERHGVGSLEQMFMGFTALPPAMAPDDWRTVLGNPRNLGEAEANYRDRMKYAHPDVEGGNEIVAAKLNAAIEKAREVFND